MNKTSVRKIMLYSILMTIVINGGNIFDSYSEICILNPSWTQSISVKVFVVVFCPF